MRMNRDSVLVKQWLESTLIQDPRVMCWAWPFRYDINYLVEWIKDDLCVDAVVMMSVDRHTRFRIEKEWWFVHVCHRWPQQFQETQRLWKTLLGFCEFLEDLVEISLSQKKWSIFHLFTISHPFFLDFPFIDHLFSFISGINFLKPFIETIY